MILYYWPGASSMVPHIVLEEIGTPYQRQLVDLARGEHKGDAYLKINPHGKVPALAVDDTVLTENVAILTYLAKRFPEAQLLPDGVIEQARCVWRGSRARFTLPLRISSGLSVSPAIAPRTCFPRGCWNARRRLRCAGWSKIWRRARMPGVDNITPSPTLIIRATASLGRSRRKHFATALRGHAIAHPCPQRFGVQKRKATRKRTDGTADNSNRHSR